MRRSHAVQLVTALLDAVGFWRDDIYLNDTVQTSSSSSAGGTS